MPERAGRHPDLMKRALTPEARTALADESMRACAGGIFDMPTFVGSNEVFFGNDWVASRPRERPNLSRDQPMT